jgi:hypothetical protein
VDRTTTSTALHEPTQERPRRLYTIGHGTLPADDFLTLLRRRRIERLVDVRSFPGSRRNPQYGREAMAGWLPDGGVTYEWEQRLGGRRRKVVERSRHTAWREAAFRSYADWMETDEFAAGLRRLTEPLQTDAGDSKATADHTGDAVGDLKTTAGDAQNNDDYPRGTGDAAGDTLDTDVGATSSASRPGERAEQRTAYMCSESLWWRCHRRLISDHLVLVEGIEVLHLMHDGRDTLHVPMAEARVEDGIVIYDGGALPLG